MTTGDFFSDADMAELREVADSARGSTATIRRQSRTSDGMGGFSTAHVAVGTVSAHVYPMKKGDESVAGAQVVSQSPWYVGVPYDTTVLESDYIDVAGVTYLVTAVPSLATWMPELRLETVVYNREELT